MDKKFYQEIPLQNLSSIYTSLVNAWTEMAKFRKKGTTIGQLCLECKDFQNLFVVYSNVSEILSERIAREYKGPKPHEKAAAYDYTLDRE